MHNNINNLEQLNRRSKTTLRFITPLISTLFKEIIIIQMYISQIPKIHLNSKINCENPFQNQA